MDTKTCLRCQKLGRISDHPISEFYKDSDGKPLATCKTCRRELSKDYHKRILKEEHGELPSEGKIQYPAGLARTLVTQGVPYGPTVVVWRCASCYRRSITRNKTGETPKLPTGWKSMAFRFGSKAESVIVCNTCFRALALAQKILNRITQRVEQEKKDYATSARPH